MSNQNRVKAGIPEGGQWSETAKARPPVPTFGRNYEQSRYDVDTGRVGDPGVAHATTDPLFRVVSFA